MNDQGATPPSVVGRTLEVAPSARSSEQHPILALHRVRGGLVSGRSQEWPADAPAAGETFRTPASGRGKPLAGARRQLYWRKEL